MRPTPKKSSPIVADTKPVQKAAVTTIAGFVALLLGLFLAFGLPAVLVVGGATAVVFGLVWETE